MYRHRLWTFVLLVGLIAPAPSLGALAGQGTDGAALPLVAPAASTPPAPATAPLAAPPWWSTWTRDADGDRIDDAIVRVERQGLDAARTAEGLPAYAVRSGPDGLLYDVFVRFEGVPHADVIARIAEQVDVPLRAYAWAEVVHLRGVSRDAMDHLLDLPGVRGIELDRIVMPTLATASAALNVNSSDLGRGARERWKVDGEGVVIAVLDTGIDQEHSAFDRLRFVGGYDATRPALTVDGAHAETPLNTMDPDDDSASGHGTHVASLAVADHPNGTLRGVSPKAGYLDVKVMVNVLGESVGTTSTPYGFGSMVIEGLDFVRRYNLGESHLGEPMNGTARVVSMSLGEVEPDPNGSTTLSHAVDRLVDDGIVVVAAAGNCGPAMPCGGNTGNNTVAAPGAAKRAVTVGAMDDKGTVAWDDDVLADFSSRGPNGGEPKPNLVAYGVGIRGAQGAPGLAQEAGGGLHELSGTSMSTPLVAGIVALMFQADASLDADEVKRILLGTARDAGVAGWDAGHGHGVANAYFAVGVATGILDLQTTRVDETGREIPDLDYPEITEAPTPTPTQRTLANVPPKVEFTFAPTMPDPGEVVVFADRSMDPEGHGLVQWAWDFGDGQTAKGQRVAHTYDQAGEYKVRLTVTDANGTAGSSHETIRVGDPALAVEESPALGLHLVPVVVALLLVIGALRRRSPACTADPS